MVASVSTATVVEFLKSGKELGRAVVQPQDVIQGLDVALRHAPSTAYLACNKSFFNPNVTQKMALSKTLELLYGHYQSLCLGSRVTLNIDCKEIY